MSYRNVMGFVNVLYGVTIPRRNGTVPRGTEFSNMHAAYEGLSDDVKVRLRDATALHDFEKFWEHMRRDKASTRPPLTEEQRRKRPPVTHPVFMTHPITGRNGPDEYRLMKRCQVMATKILDPHFVRGALGEHVPAHAAR
jgi:taurine dioxygenase